MTDRLQPTPSAWARQTIRRFLWMLGAVSVVFLATEVAALSAGFAPLRPLSFPEVSGNILFAIGFGCPLVLYLSSLPGWRNLAASAVVGTVLTLILWSIQE